MFQNSWLNRWIFIVVSAIILFLVIGSTLAFFNQLKENERAKMEIWAEAQKEIASIAIDEDASLSDIALSVISINNTTPMISYSHKDEIYDSKNIDSLILKSPAKRDALIAQFSSEYSPLEIRYKDELFSTVYYGNSPTINKLKYYPLALLLIIGLFFSTVYYIFKTGKSAEQNRLWAGMAKETAHQIGTPLSSLIGWNEILKTEDVNPDYIKEMGKDIQRLEIIADRFSKVGSVPKLEPKDIVHETQEAFDYLKSRSSKLITFESNLPNEKIMVNLNPQLFGWTIENLVKNGIDAMRGKGTLQLSLEQKGKQVYIQITDSGKGISKQKFKQVFKPGYTTKKRGWGLGLSLAKRIIEEYHQGKIRVSSSTLGKSTTMEIALKTID